MVVYVYVIRPPARAWPFPSAPHPSPEIGWRAAALLLGVGEPEQVLFQPELVVRASSGA